MMKNLTRIGAAAVLSALSLTAVAQPADGSGAVELRDAYQKEFAFLVAQRRELEQRIAAFRDEARRELVGTESRSSRLQDEVLALEANAESMQSELAEVERSLQSAERNADVVRATFQQADVILQAYGDDLLADDAFNALPEAERLARVFERGVTLLGELGSVRTVPGEFFTTAGDKVGGEIVRYGDVAAYGVAESVAGILVPAGGGELKLWRDPQADAARALASGVMPTPLPVFIFSSRDRAVDTAAQGGVIDKVDAGGTIAWVIMALALLGLVLIIARIVFLRRASASTGEIVHEIGELVSANKIDEAIEACRARAGSTAAVVASALRNLHRDRESLDDIINEAILHESAHLERFGTMILVIAAVAPLLGLLGTVTGMITTFEVITEYGTGDPSLLSGGISIALITTELGLMVAIPTLLIGNMLSGWGNRIKDEMQKAALRVTNLYASAQRPGA